MVHVLIRGVLAVLFIQMSLFHCVLVRRVPAVPFIEVSSFHGVLIRGVPARVSDGKKEGRGFHSAS